MKRSLCGLMLPFFFASCAVSKVHLKSNVPDVKVQILFNGQVIQETTGPGPIELKGTSKNHCVFRVTKPGYRPYTLLYAFDHEVLKANLVKE